MTTKEEMFYKNVEALLPTTFFLESKKKKFIFLKLTDALEDFDAYSTLPNLPIHNPIIYKACTDKATYFQAGRLHKLVIS